MKNSIFLFSICYFSIALTALVGFSAYAEHGSQENLSKAQQQEQQQESYQTKHEFSDAELAQMLAPIALYPDSLLTHILIAATYPIEIIEAFRWLKKNEGQTTKQLAQSVEDFEWDASVKALIPFERVLSRLSEDLTWMQQLGDAFLQDETRLLASIQALRKQAELAGNLDKMDNMEVSYEENNIIIEPVEKEVVYVPYYDTRLVYGTWHWSSYPPVYWTPHHNVYVSHYSPFYWHSGIHISFNYFFNAFHWHNRYVMVVNPYRSHHRYYHQRPRRSISSGGYAKRWSHQPTHRRGVAYRTKQVSHKYHSNRVSVHKTSEPLHFSQKNKVQRNEVKRHSVKRDNSQGNFKARLSAQSHATKKHVTKSHTSKNNTLRSTPQKNYTSKHYASKHQALSKRKVANKVPAKNNARSRTVPKQHATNVHHKEVREKKSYQHKANQNKAQQQKVRSNRATTRNHKQSNHSTTASVRHQ